MSITKSRHYDGEGAPTPARAGMHGDRMEVSPA